MSDKKAFVFDTNFIIQNKELDEALNKLKEQFTVYITQVSIDERIAQRCREVRKDFEAIEQCKEKYALYITIDYKTTFEEEILYYQKGMQSKYEDYFGDKIIPLKKDEEVLSTVIDRANKRIPPFSSAKDSSDKGFKDCLLWISLLEYFKNNGESQVVFVSDDGGFKNNVDFLCEEFRKITGKTIEIQQNSFYKELLNQIQTDNSQEDIQQDLTAEELPNLETFRIEVEDVVDALRWIEYEDFFGDLQWSRTFTTSVPFDKSYIRTFFEGLRSDIASHIFETSVPASKILDFDGRVIDGDAEIPIKNLEKAFSIYQRVKNNYATYSEQFFEAAAKILNRNYVAPKTITDIDDDLPF